MQNIFKYIFQALEIMEYREDLEYYWIDGPGRVIQINMVHSENIEYLENNKDLEYWGIV